MKSNTSIYNILYNNTLYWHNYKRLSSVSLTALIKPCVLSVTGLPNVVISAKSLVILPSSTVLMQAFSSVSANFESSGSESSSPLFLKAPVHANIVAIGLVDVSSPLRCL